MGKFNYILEITLKLKRLTIKMQKWPLTKGQIKIQSC